MSLNKMALLSTCVALALTGCGGGDVKEKVHSIGDHLQNIAEQVDEATDGAKLAHTEADFIKELTHDGARVNGTQAATNAAQWIHGKMALYGYAVQDQPYGTGVNVVADIPGNNPDQMLIVGAHYDTKAGESGDAGVTDNAAGVATLVGMAKQFENEHPDYTIRMVFFGAGEEGQQGSKYFVDHMSQDEVDATLGMINLDAIVGGDKLYLEAPAASQFTCAGLNPDTQLRDHLQSVTTDHKINPLRKEYLTSEIDASNDLAAFACRGIPSVNIEATNMAIFGQSGNQDGVSQSTNDAFWSTKFNKNTMTANDPQAEQDWGVIRHTGNDNMARLQKTSVWSQVIEGQLTVHNSVLHHFLKHPGL